MAFLLDTNVLSELRKGLKCHQRVRAWADSTIGERHCISVLSLGEIRRGIEILRRKAPDQCSAFESWLDRLKAEYNQEIIPIAEDIVDRWGRLNAARTQPVIDGLLAATAIEHKLTIATRNTGDFENTGVALINPFLGPAVP